MVNASSSPTTNTDITVTAWHTKGQKRKTFASKNNDFMSDWFIYSLLFFTDIALNFMQIVYPLNRRRGLQRLI